MPTPRKSIEQLKMTGTYQRNKGRYAAREKAEKVAQAAQSLAAPIGPPPTHLKADEKKVWREIVKDSPGISRADRLLLEVATKLLCKMRTEGLKSAENTKLIALLEGFKGSTNPEPILSTNPAPTEDTRTESEKAWDEFVAEEEKEQRMEKLIGEEVARRKQTTPPDHLTETQKKYWAYYHSVKRDLFPDEYGESDERCQRHIEWCDNQIAQGLSTKYVDPKFRQPKEPEKVEWTPPPREPREPYVDDPAKRLERLKRKWSMG